jgi:hypothetical protein
MDQFGAIMNLIWFIQVSGIIFILKPIFFIISEFPKSSGPQTYLLESLGLKLQIPGHSCNYLTLCADGGFIWKESEGSYEDEGVSQTLGLSIQNRGPRLDPI